MQAPREQSAPKCAGGCGFYGSPATENFCSVCYKSRLSQKQDSTIPAPAASPVVVQPTSGSEPHSPTKATAESAAATASAVIEIPSPTDHTEEAKATSPASEENPEQDSLQAEPQTVTQADPSRCYKCNKRVGLLGFKCRCGAICCRPHLHAEEHGCTFDYQAMARHSLEFRNPRVVTEKFDRI